MVIPLLKIASVNITDRKPKVLAANAMGDDSWQIKISMIMVKGIWISTFIPGGIGKKCIKYPIRALKQAVSNTFLLGTLTSIRTKPIRMTNKASGKDCRIIR